MLIGTVPMGVAMWGSLAADDVRFYAASYAFSNRHARVRRR